ncbi:hypothetical protein E2C01_055585 [Portunus trituberculatus]|uniref:Uncharacterized protein n=1 Tax=Portunus trituberculatus TaxID=210409 RepID=A0A5B7GRL8_PORTR|nr:hypothetical protein [Portunus trituberculatus]
MSRTLSLTLQPKELLKGGWEAVRLLSSFNTLAFTDLDPSSVPFRAITSLLHYPNLYSSYPAVVAFPSPPLGRVKVTLIVTSVLSRHARQDGRCCVTWSANSEY